MLNFLAARENGTQSPFSLEKAEATKRSFTLELSKQRDFQKMHSGGINSLDIDPVEGRYLLSGGSDGILAIHDLHNTAGEPKYNHPAICTVGRSNKDMHKFSVETVQWYPFDTGMFTSSGMDKTLKVWDTNSLMAVDTYLLNGVVYCHDLSPIATKHCLLAIASMSHKVKLVDLKTGSDTHILRGHKKPVLNVKWSTKDEYLLASGSEDGRILFWDIRSAKGTLMVLDQHNGDTTASPNSVNTAHNGFINSMCFTQDGLHFISYGTDDRIRLWNASTGKNTLTNYGKVYNGNRKALSISVSQDSRPDLIYVPAESNIEVFDMICGTNICTLRGHYNQVNCCVFHPAHHELYSGGSDRNILIWTADSHMESTYEDSLRTETSDTKQTSFVRRIGTCDTWSSDEDD